MPQENTYNSIYPTLGVVAISKNEERDLPVFLEHLETWVDEIVIVDDGSTDATINILKSAGAMIKLIEQTMTEDGFAGQRNRGIEEARSDWLLHMDIDERVPPALSFEIRQAIASSSHNAYRYRRKNFFLNRIMKGGDLRGWNRPQLARRGYHRFEGVVHESCIINGAPDTIGQLNSEMWHLNDESYQERMFKSMRYCREISVSIDNKGIHVHWYDFLIRPFVEFVRQFIVKHGYRDGTAGLVWALHAADATFRTYVMAWDRQHPVSRSDIELAILRAWQGHGGEEHEGTGK